MEKFRCKPLPGEIGLYLRMERSLLRESAPISEGPDPEGLEDFDALMRQHQPRIFRFLLASLRDRDAAENLTQDCFVRAYKAREQFRGGSR